MVQDFVALLFEVLEKKKTHLNAAGLPNPAKFKPKAVIWVHFRTSSKLPSKPEPLHRLKSTNRLDRRARLAHCLVQTVLLVTNMDFPKCVKFVNSGSERDNLFSAYPSSCGFLSGKCRNPKCRKAAGQIVAMTPS